MNTLMSHLNVLQGDRKMRTPDPRALLLGGVGLFPKSHTDALAHSILRVSTSCFPKDYVMGLGNAPFPAVTMTGIRVRV